MTHDPDIFSHVLMKMMMPHHTPNERARIARALDAAVAFGMWRAMGGETDGRTREEIKALFFQKSGSL